MEENQIDPVPFVSDTQASLASDEREVTPELEQKMFKMPYQRVLQV